MKFRMFNEFDLNGILISSFLRPYGGLLDTRSLMVVLDGVGKCLSETADRRLEVFYRFNVLNPYTWVLNQDFILNCVGRKYKLKLLYVITYLFDL